MKNHLFLVLVFMVCNLNNYAQKKQCGPYTVYEIGNKVYRIEDSNDNNPPGKHSGELAKTNPVNNCSDMYLIVGKEKALLIDLSNHVNWDTTAVESLRKIVFARTGGKPLTITVTHFHGDHLGMLPAFRIDEKVLFRINEAEFSGVNVFPAKRTNFFKDNDEIDLGGGCLVQAMELRGHTPHSTIFLLNSQHLVFTGDALGSGNGMWLLDEPSFYVFRTSVQHFIEYIENSANHVDVGKLIIYPGHYWQKGKPEELTAKYIYDMRSLIGEMEKGTATTDTVSYKFLPFLNTNFRYGTAVITWNKEAAERLTK
jgi:glyoxylase-like metal-dependent hydrolase (beta-lactamase superfamily II)